MDAFLPLVVAGGMALGVLAIAVGLASGGRQGTVASRLERYASAGGDVTPARPAADGRESAVVAGLTRVIERQDLNERMATALARADLKLKPAEFIILWAVTPVIVVGVAYLLSVVLPSLANPFALIGLGLVGLYLPRFYLKRRQAKRLNAFNEQLPDTITLLANSLRAGSSFLQGIELVTREARPPISEEFERVVREMQLGVALHSALNSLVRRVASEDLELMVTAIQIQSQVGGNLATVLDAIAFTIRERGRIQGEIRTLTAMQRYSGYVITLLPVGLGAILFLVSPTYITPMLARPPAMLGLPLGVVFFLVGLVSMGIGYLFIRRIVDIKV